MQCAEPGDGCSPQVGEDPGGSPVACGHGTRAHTLVRHRASEGVTVLTSAAATHTLVSNTWDWVRCLCPEGSCLEGRNTRSYLWLDARVSC
jgi:hypothetical protein